METNTIKNLPPNQLDIFRHKRRFSMSEVAHLLGHRGTSALSHYERSVRLPSLTTALRLGIILRTPIEFLFGKLHDELLLQIRAEEERLAVPIQQVLF